MKIWFKGYIKNKQKLSQAFDFSRRESLFDILVHCCNEFDLPTPIILEKHQKYFDEFLLVRFFKTDFIEQVPYDVVELEVFE